MKAITIWSRRVLERTGFRKYPFKEVTQYTIEQDGKLISNHDVDIYNKRLKVNFTKDFTTRGKGILKDYINHLGRSDADKWMKEQITKILEVEESKY